jgi:hypothetical protein
MYAIRRLSMSVPRHARITPISQFWRRSRQSALGADASSAEHGHPDDGDSGRSRDAPPTTSTLSVEEVEMKDARMMFDIAWDNLVKNFGEENLVFPKGTLSTGS